MPSHIKAMLTGVSLHVPVHGGAPALGTWQGIYLVEHRARSHRREVMLQFVGTRALSALMTFNGVLANVFDRPG